MINVQLIQIDILNQIINYIDSDNLKKARDRAVQFRDTLQEDIDKAESDIDVQLNLENENKIGK